MESFYYDSIGHLNFNNKFQHIPLIQLSHFPTFLLSQHQILQNILTASLTTKQILHIPLITPSPLCKH